MDIQTLDHGGTPSVWGHEMGGKLYIENPVALWNAVDIKRGWNIHLKNICKAQ